MKLVFCFLAVFLQGCIAEDVSLYEMQRRMNYVEVTDLLEKEKQKTSFRKDQKKMFLHIFYTSTHVVDDS